MSTASDSLGAGGARQIARALPDEAATEALGRELALFLRAGDWVLLHGDLGAGKTTLARAIIRALAPAEAGEFEVPSPTFTLVQPYDFTRVPVAHVDLYRLSDPYEVDELGLEELARDHVLLVEWPQRLPDMPADRLEIHLEETDKGASRRAVLKGFGAWEARLERMEQVRAFLERALGNAHVERRFLQGDASARRYERLTAPDGRRLILMDMPESADGPPIRDGKSYGELVHLARGVRAVVGVNMELKRRGYSAPEVMAHDLDAGLLLLEDLGDAVFGRLYARGEEMMRTLLRAATEVLAHMASAEWPDRAALPDGGFWPIATYDAQAFLIEAELLADWFWEHVSGAPCPAEARAEYVSLMQALIAHARAGAPVWVLRDYHSPNLIWLPAREGIARVGLIDTQDAVLGPAGYDLASLLQDARVDIPEHLEQEMLKHYCALRARDAGSAGFDEAAFITSYHVLGAQRAAKVLGIFARLKARDDKPGYLKHLPRVAHWLVRDLERLARADIDPARRLLAFFDARLPQVRALAAQHQS